MLLTKTTIGSPIVTWADAQPYLKANAADQATVEALIAAATQHAETWTNRAARANQWTMLRDDFLECDGGPMRLPMADVASVVSVKRTVGGSAVAVSDSVYQLKSMLSEAFLVERSGQAWPSDADSIEHAVEVVFQQVSRVPAEMWKEGILRHVALLWADRGDAEPASVAFERTGVLQTAKQSGAEDIYAAFRVPMM